VNFVNHSVLNIATISANMTYNDFSLTPNVSQGCPKPVFELF